MSESTVLVIGGAGYIGSHICRALHASGITPVTFDSLYKGHEWAIQWGPFVQGDVRNKKDLQKAFSQHKLKGVIHFAALSEVGESVQNPAKYYDFNVLGTKNVLDIMLENKVDKIVFSSTCATYGVPNRVPIDEDHAQDPISPYGKSKLAIEFMLKDYFNAYGLRSVGLRYFNAAGAAPDGSIGEDHDPESHLIPIVLDSITGRRQSLSVFGSDYETRDGTCIRDYIHVDDLADAHIRALKFIAEEPCCDFFNLGTGTGYSVLEIIQMVEKVTGKKVPYKKADRRPGDPPALVSNSKKAHQVLGWTPESSDLENIVQSAWNWHQSHHFKN